MVGSGLLQSVSYTKPIPTHEKIFAVGKRGPNATFNPFFLRLGWPWVGEFVGFTITFIYFPTQQNFVSQTPYLIQMVLLFRDRVVISTA